VVGKEVERTVERKSVLQHFIVVPLDTMEYCRRLERAAEGKFVDKDALECKTYLGTPPRSEVHNSKLVLDVNNVNKSH